MPRVGIALGSNLGDRLANLRAAFALLESVSTGGEQVLAAPVYRTEPVGCPAGSPGFYNTVVEISFSGKAFELLETTRAIERQIGREPTSERNAPREVDIDLLYFGDELIDTEELTLPHPRLASRRFVLQPLADIRPNLVLPGNNRSIREMLQNLVSDEPQLCCVARLSA